MRTLNTSAHPDAARYRKWLVFATISLIAVAVLWHWNGLIASVAELHKTLHVSLSQHIKAVAKDADTYGLGLMVMSFSYGIFHAVGPGHGKAVIATYLGTHQTSAVKGVAISLATALMQSLVAIMLVVTIAKVLEFSFADLARFGSNLELVSYSLVAMLGLLLAVTAARRFLALKRSTIAPHQHDAKQTHGQHAHDHSHSHEHPSRDHDHGHGSCCSCQHSYVPEADESRLHTLAIVFSIGLRPCSGAILVLVYAHLVGVFHYGIAATFAMGLGTGISVSAIAIASQYARRWLENILTQGSNRAVQLLDYAYVNLAFRFAGGAILFLLGWGLLQYTLDAGPAHLYLHP